MKLKRNVAVPVIIGLAIALAAGIFFVAGRTGALSKQDRIHRNTFRVAREYIEHEEFQRALALLEGILIDDPDNETARSLRDDALRLQRAVREVREARPEPEDGGREALETALALQAEALAAQNRIVQSQLDADRARQDAAATRGGPSAEQAEADARAEAEEERRALAAAEEARRRAEEEELARRSAEVQARMREIRELVTKGRAALQEGDIAAAEEFYQAALGRMPAGEQRFDAAVRADIADAYYEAAAARPGTPDGAESLSRASSRAHEAIERDRNLAQPHSTLGRIARDNRRWEQAVAEFQIASRLEAGNYLYALELGRAHFNMRNYPAAIEAFESATGLNPQAEQAWYNLGGAYRMNSRQNDALAAYRKAIEIKPDYAVAHRETGRILAARGNSAGAIESFSRCLLYAPGDLAALRELGTVQSGVRDHAGAESSFAVALALAPADAQTNYNMALVKLELHKYGEAAEHARQAAGANPLPVYFYTLGLASEGHGDDEGAIQAYARAAALNDKYVRPRINLGRIYLANNMAPQALQILLEAWRVEPASFEVNNNLGAAYAKQEDWAKSVEFYEKALLVEPQNMTVRLNLARAYVGAANLGRAREQYQEVLRIAPDNGDALFELGKTCASLGDVVSARTSLETLLSRNPDYPGKAEAERILGGL